MLLPAYLQQYKLKFRKSDLFINMGFGIKRPRLLSEYGTNPYVRALAGTAGLISSAAPYAKKAYKLTRTLTKKRTQTDAQPLTYQNDNALRYRKKRMPRRKRKSWIRFMRKVAAVDLSLQPLQIYTSEGTTNQTSSVNQGQVWSRVLGGTTLSGNDELYQIFQGAYNVANVAACVPYKIYLKSIVMDIEVTNTGSYPVIIDVYTLKNRSKFASATDVGAQYIAALGEVQAPAGGGSFTSSKTALTAFDAPNFCSYWKIMIKREVIIGSNNTVTFQLRSPANRHIEGKELQSSLQCLRGSRAMLFTWHGQPCNRGAAGAAQFDSTALTFGYQTVVHYALPPSSTTKEAGKTG